MKNWSNQPTGSYKKKWGKDFTFGSDCTVHPWRRRSGGTASGYGHWVIGTGTLCSVPVKKKKKEKMIDLIMGFNFTRFQIDHLRIPAMHSVVMTTFPVTAQPSLLHCRTGYFLPPTHLDALLQSRSSTPIKILGFSVLGARGNSKPIWKQSLIQSLETDAQTSPRLRLVCR